MTEQESPGIIYSRDSTIPLLNFEEQRAFSVLQSLQQDTHPVDATRVDPVKFPNTDFYPIQTCPPVLDLFQELVENDLKILHQNVSTQRNKNMNQAQNLRP